MGRDPQKQRDAKRRWYERHRDVYYTRNKVRRDRLRLMVEGLKSAPCLDCGGTFPPECMDYDHLSDKRFAVSAIVNSRGTVTSIRREIAKCELVCANCHRVRTRRRLDEQADARVS